MAHKFVEVTHFFLTSVFDSFSLYPYTCLLVSSVNEFICIFLLSRETFVPR